MNLPYQFHDFADARLLWLLLLIPVCIIWYIVRNKEDRPAFQIPATGKLREKKFARVRLRHLLFILRMLACCSLIIAIARPQKTFSSQTINSEGIDIQITLDVSGSMLASDVKPNRLEAAKDVAASFISGRPNDRIGIILFADQALTASPVTIDHVALLQILRGVHTMEMANGTAIGMGLGTAVNHLKESKSLSRVIILITDGENNAGSVLPLQAAQLAYDAGVRVYTIGLLLGKTSSEITEKLQTLSPNYLSANELLARISEVTKGKFFLANDKNELAEVFTEIGELEKTKVDVTTYTRYEDSFYPFAIIASILLLLEVILRFSLFKSVLS
ncbi:MAG: VWA domain-containing protein [Chitinophagales bacterium]